MNHQTRQLHKELIAAGADVSEAHELGDIAARLHVLKKPQTVRPSRAKLFGALGFAAACALTTLVILSQSVLPSSRLFPVQKAADAIAVTVRPSYRANVMMRRAEQVKSLVAAQAPSSTILATLDDYKRQADTYQAAYTDYEVFERCKASLQQASAHATGSERDAINNVLQALHNV